MARFIPLVIALIVFAIALSWPRSELTSKDFLNQIYTASGQIDPNATKAVWFNEDIPVPTAELAYSANKVSPNVLGDSSGDKWIEIDLSKQMLYAHEGNGVAFEFPVSTGLPWMPTVTGEFRIWAKIRSQRMSGGSIADGTFYDLPNVIFVQYFYKGYGMHGTYWHNDFGKPRSHGCVNISNANAERLYYWTDPALPTGKYSLTNIKPEQSTRVIVHGTTPSNIN